MKQLINNTKLKDREENMGNKSKTLIIFYNIGVQKNVRFQKLLDFVGDNWEFYILSYWPTSYNFFGNIKLYSIKSKKQSRMNSIISHRIPIFPDSYLIHLKEVQNHLKNLLLSESFNNCIISMPLFSQIKLAKYIKEINPEICVIADMLDPFSFYITNSNQNRINKALNIEKEYFPYYDYIINLNDSIVDKYQDLYPELKDRFKVIEQGVDVDFINKIKSYPENLSNSFTFLYTGIFYKKGRSPNNIYNAFNKIQEKCKLYIYGNYKMVLHPPQSSSINYHHSIKRDELAKVIASANALVIVDNEWGYQVPGKTLETLAVCKPILFIYNNEQSPTLKYIREAKGVVWAKNNTEDIMKGIEKIIGGEYEEPYFDYSPYTWEKLMEKYQELLL